VKSKLIVLLACAAAIVPLIAAPQEDSRQAADQDWSPVLHRAAFAAGMGPQVLVDAAHGNFHTLDGRFKAFGDLLTLDGYRVAAAESVVTNELLAGTSIFVISNAVYGGEDAEWALPTPSAFTPDEIETIVEWVHDGGALLLIADHMPFPGAAASLADSFGVIFYNGYAKKSLNEGGTLSFTRSSGQLANHPVTNGRSDEESIESVRGFTGQAFRFVSNAQPLMSMPDDWQVFLPVEAGEFDETTPVISARGLVQGAVLHFGRGRVAVFGEAAMFTAQTWVRDGVTGQMGMNHPSAAENPQFIVNVMHWLSGLLDD
jgi:hypothetical protein